MLLFEVSLCSICQFNFKILSSQGLESEQRSESTKVTLELKKSKKKEKQSSEDDTVEPNLSSAYSSLYAQIIDTKTTPVDNMSNSSNLSANISSLNLLLTILPLTLSDENHLCSMVEVMDKSLADAGLVSGSMDGGKSHSARHCFDKLIYANPVVVKVGKIWEKYVELTREGFIFACKTKQISLVQMAICFKLIRRMPYQATEIFIEGLSCAINSMDASDAKKLAEVLIGFFFQYCNVGNFKVLVEK